jgi:hypothetical protein
MVCELTVSVALLTDFPTPPSPLRHRSEMDTLLVTPIALQPTQLHTAKKKKTS